jgi:hypothetical protein
VILYQKRPDHPSIRAWTRDSADQITCSYSGEAFQSLLLSWNTHSFPRDNLQFSISLQQSSGCWSPELRVASWGMERRHGYKTRQGSLSIDVDVLHCVDPSRAFKVFVRGSIELLRRLVVVFKPESGVIDSDEPFGGSAVDLEVPERSQRTVTGGDSHRLCSPTSLSMVLQYLGRSCDIREVAANVFDHGQNVFGNWSFNVAYAGSLGFDSMALWLEQLSDIEPLLSAGLPIIVSHKFDQFKESPLAKTAGHLIVIRGFTGSGDVIVNDPAADPRIGESVRRVYPRKTFARSWSGLCYLIRPRS